MGPVRLDRDGGVEVAGETFSCRKVLSAVPMYASSAGVMAGAEVGPGFCCGGLPPRLGKRSPLPLNEGRTIMSIFGDSVAAVVGGRKGEALVALM